MLFFPNLDSKNKPNDLKNVPIVPCRFSNDLFTLKKCRILHIEKAIKNFGFQAFNKHSADNLIVAYTFEI